MALELLFLLLPVAALSGWWVGKRRMLSSPTLKLTPQFSTQYFQGLNYLINEQPDKAIDVFIKMLEVDCETVETHFTLANLFRRRGEVDRAIRIHQNLIARPTLSQEQRAQALYELGLDYMRAGILGRAEGLFLELVEDHAKNVQALEQLIDIYQQEKDWDKAITTLQKYITVTGRGQQSVIAQYYCELAEDARYAGDFDRATKMLRQALASDKGCVRASILEGKYATEKGDLKVALRAYKRVEHQDLDYLPEIIEPLIECSRKIGKLDEIVEYLNNILVEHGGISVMLALAEIIRQRDGDQVAANFITEQLRKKPSVRGLHRLIELNLSMSHGDARENLLILRDLTTKLLKNRSIYKCNQCGFSGKSLHWHCPGCKSWNSIKPIQGVEGE